MKMEMMRTSAAKGVAAAVAAIVTLTKLSSSGVARARRCPEARLQETPC
jgi:hypothetical protein